MHNQSFLHRCPFKDSLCFFQSLISSWRSERSHQTHLPPGTTPLILRSRLPSALTRKPNGPKTPSLPCRLALEHLPVGPVWRSALWMVPLENGPPVPFQPLASCYSVAPNIHRRRADCVIPFVEVFDPSMWDVVTPYFTFLMLHSKITA